MENEDRLEYVLVSEIAPASVNFRDKRSGVLRSSVAENGVLQAVMVRPLKTKGKFRYQAIFGQGRIDESKRAGLRKIAATIRDCDENEALRLSYVENMHRDNWSVLEEARACSALRKRGFSLREMEKLSEGKRSYALISERIALWDNTTEETKKAVASGKLEASTVEYVVHKYRNKQTKKVNVPQTGKVLEEVAKRGLSLEETVAFVRGRAPYVEVQEKAKVITEANEEATTKQGKEKPSPKAEEPKPEPKPQYWVLEKSPLIGKILSVDREKGDVAIQTSEGLRADIHFSPPDHEDIVVLLKKAREGVEKGHEDVLRIGLQLETITKKKRLEQPIRSR